MKKLLAGNPLRLRKSAETLSEAPDFVSLHLLNAGIRPSSDSQIWLPAACLRLPFLLGGTQRAIWPHALTVGRPC
jgi:hypothetical protein